jgi:ABC-type polysaccharide/polyol phosphate transport system ATPase subunit
MIALRAENVGKKYDLYRRPADRLKEMVWPGGRTWHREIWALRNLYLEIPRGATWGIIGPNGAGKSTLLQLVTGTSRPTTGTLDVQGNVSGILELGHGFNPDFSGRANVFMNCSILGMTRAEARERFESIVDFAELWEVIERPVRTYSSGMYLRLAFAVATSVDPDILVVDEALGVGDEYFRGKCYHRINDFRRAGKTVLFVSHALGVVRNLCDHVVLLDRGEIRAQGAPQDVADTYLKLVHEQSEQRLRAAHRRAQGEEAPRWGSGQIEVREVRCLGAGGAERYSFTPGDAMTIEARYRVKADLSRPVFGVGVFRSDGTYLCGLNHLWHEEPIEIEELRAGETGRVRCTIDPLPLLKGSYYLSYYCYDHSGAVPTPVDHRERVRMFQVTEGPVEMHGTVALPARWEVER